MGSSQNEALSGTRRNRLLGSQEWADVKEAKGISATGLVTLAWQQPS